MSSTSQLSSLRWRQPYDDEPWPSRGRSERGRFGRSSPGAPPARLMLVLGGGARSLGRPRCDKDALAPWTVWDVPWFANGETGIAWGPFDCGGRGSAGSKCEVMTAASAAKTAVVGPVSGRLPPRLRTGSRVSKTSSQVSAPPGGHGEWSSSPRRSRRPGNVADHRRRALDPIGRRRPMAWTEHRSLR